MSAKVLLYSPSLIGHPQVYCRVIGRALLDADCDITIAAAHDPARVFSDWRDLRPFRDESRVRFIDTRRFSSAGAAMLTAEELTGLQRTSGADSTLLIEGDHFGSEFRRIAAREAPRLRGRSCAIFANTCKWFPGEDPYSGEREPFIGPTLRRTLGRWKRALLNRRQSARYFFEHVLIDQKAVDAVIVKDERVTRRYGPPVHWMPEIYRVFDSPPEERRGPDWEQFAEPIQQYVRRAGPENVLLYFGTGAWYKGYDYFLKLAELDESTFALHAGAPERREAGKPYDFDVQALRQKLLAQGRLFETNQYVESADLVELLFHSIERFVSTHRLTASSGTMLQALEAGKPVLTPQTGLVGWRTRTFNLGMTYQYLDVNDLARRWRAFRGAAIAQWQAQIPLLMATLTQAETERFFVCLAMGKPHRRPSGGA